jgi:hypothetical protein
MKKIISSFLLGGLLFGSAGAYAAGGNLIEVFYTIKAIKIDNVTQNPDKKPFAYEGTTYVPLRFISEKLDKEVKWDQNTQTIFIGNQIDESAYFLGDKIQNMNYQSYYGDYENVFGSRDTISSNIGKEYENYLSLYNPSTYSGGAFSTIQYPLNGQFKKFVSTVGITSNYQNSRSTINVNVYADDKIVYQNSFEPGSMPTDINVNVENALKLIIETTIEEVPGDDGTDTSEIGFFNPHLLK